LGPMSRAALQPSKSPGNLTTGINSEYLKRKRNVLQQVSTNCVDSVNQSESENDTTTAEVLDNISNMSASSTALNRKMRKESNSMANLAQQTPVSSHSKALSSSKKRTNGTNTADQQSSHHASSSSFASQRSPRDLPVKCPACHAGLKDDTQHLRLHLKSEHPRLFSKITFRCSACPYDTQYRSTFRGHLESVHRVSAPDQTDIHLISVFECALCRDVMHSIDEIVEHFREEHGGLENLPAARCLERDPNAPKKGRGRPRLIRLDEPPETKVDVKLKLLGPVAKNGADTRPADENIFDEFF